MTGPCAWTIDTSCCATVWADASPGLQAAATAFATDILWAATGRQFGLCSLTVRPCLREGSWGFLYYNNGYGGFYGWQPFIWGGQWFNGVCGCGLDGCVLAPYTQVSLLGPVADITQVSIEGVVLAPAAYRVDDQEFLVRQDGGHWPRVQNLDHVPGDVDTWTVTYHRGKSVPVSLNSAAGTLACEYIKACNGGECRLSGRVTSIIRQGVQMTMVDPTTLLEKGLTGLEEVDLLIRSYNPTGLSHRLRLYSPDVDSQRVTTWSSP